jgi:hypothetical protein
MSNSPANSYLGSSNSDQALPPTLEAAPQIRSYPYHGSSISDQVLTPTLAVAPRIRSSLWSSLRSWWWLPLPLLMISTPLSARPMCGDLGVNSSSQVSAALSWKSSREIFLHPTKRGIGIEPQHNAGAAAATSPRTPELFSQQVQTIMVTQILAYTPEIPMRKT